MKRFLSILLLALPMLWTLTFDAYPSVGPDGGGTVLYLSKEKGTTYRLLQRITEKTGLYFIYDSHIINNERLTAIPRGEYTLSEAIRLIAGNPQLEVRVVGSHILLTLPEQKAIPKSNSEIKEPEVRTLTIKGRLVDRDAGTPIDAGTVGIMNRSIGTITNAQGEFRLVLPDSLQAEEVVFSHLGYVPQTLKVALLAGRECTLALEEKVISLQEVVIRSVNPLRLLKEMMEKRKDNYADEPVFLTSFYREGVERRNRFVSLSEGVFRVYKTSYRRGANADQIKLLKMRVISNPEEQDTLTAKMKAGLDACLRLDVMKEIPDFLNPDDETYEYQSAGLTMVDGRVVNIVRFEQNAGIFDPLYRGSLYIDSENDALLRADFEINPRYVTHAANLFIEKKSPHLSIVPQRVNYTVTYRCWQGRHYISHVRGDLYFKVRKRRVWFSTVSLHTWFEIVTCQVDNRHPVIRFTTDETLPRRTVFAETQFTYDAAFWGDFNVIPPEEKLTEALSKIQLKIEQTGN